MVNFSKLINSLLVRGMVMMTVLLAMTVPVAAQEEDEGTITEEDFVILSGHINSFIEETTSLLDYIASAQTAQIESIHHFADIINTRWKGFMLLEQEVLSQDDSLMVLVSDFEQTMKMVTDSISSREKTLQMHADFVIAEKFITKQLSEYESMLKKANQLALIEKTAPQLDELKTREQLVFAKIQESYDKAKQAAERDSKLKKRMDKLEEEYVQLKAYSAKIQECAYKPLIERAKDYLINLACVAVLLMLLNIILTRIKAYKQARKAAKDMKKMMEMQNNDIPTI